MAVVAPTSTDGPTAARTSPVRLRVGTLTAMLNAELADHPVYEAFELQWFDDEAHGTGMLAFLSRREGRTVDYYAQPGLRLDPRAYSLGGGTRSWSTTHFDVASLTVGQDGVSAHVRFTDVDGRVVEVDVDDRDGRARRRGGLLAPVGAAITEPTSLLLVWMPAFDLVRRVPGRPPLVRIDGEAAAVGTLPGARLHRRHLIKYAAPLVTVEVNRDDDVRSGPPGDEATEVAPDGGTHAVTAVGHGPDGDHSATVRFAPPFPAPGGTSAGTWMADVDGTRLTGGTWSVRADGDARVVTLRVTQRWRPRRLPLLMRVVTTVVPVFRRWPTTYAWRGTLAPDGSVTAGGWSRTGREDGTGYRRVTGS
ncbi:MULTISPECIES: hypothetical protein [unclassified Actinotalea]|uniref:hypothetical protein n=1 Tax=unclassified Actinotalea TaxID=2638618 RepID=UPI0015F3D277|nr:MULTISPECIES: hypothetical protein [unclassified Actinotalea]